MRVNFRTCFIISGLFETHICAKKRKNFASLQVNFASRVRINHTGVKHIQFSALLERLSALPRFAEEPRRLKNGPPQPQDFCDSSAANGVDPCAANAYLQGMPRLNIIKLPDPVLREKSLPVETVDAQVRAFLNDMLETMYAAPGVGLAAVQAGLLRRMLVLDTVRGDGEPKNPRMLVNPEIVWKSDIPRMHEEGCLSIPEMYADVLRPDTVRVRYVDIDGHRREEDFEGLAATVVQHEMDHLDGKLFIDHLSQLKRDLLVKKFHKAQKEKVDVL